MMKDLIHRFPDHWMANVSLARHAIIHEEQGRAAKILDTLEKRGRAHLLEYVSWAMAKFRLEMSRKNFLQAEAVLRDWEKILPEDEMLLFNREELRRARISSRASGSRI